MRAFDRALQSVGGLHLVVFDALDRTSDRVNHRRRLLRALLQVTLRMSSFRALRVKVFVRPDMLDEVSNFPDAAKLDAARAELRWGTTDLYALLWQYLGNSGRYSAEFRSLTGREIGHPWELVQKVWMRPLVMMVDPDAQEAIFHQITGPAMGRDRRRGIPYRWLPGHLSDSYRQVTPRSFLTALQHAASEPVNIRWPWALHYDDLKAGVLEASRVRVNEVKEDLPWIGPAMVPLAGLVLPCPPEDVVRRLRDEDRMTQIRHDFANASLTPRQVLDRLITAGFMYRGHDGRINMPDVYRVAFGLKLKGGVRPPQL